MEGRCGQKSRVVMHLFIYTKWKGEGIKVLLGMCDAGVFGTLITI
jgi:hypothetical protein